MSLAEVNPPMRRDHSQSRLVEGGRTLQRADLEGLMSRAFDVSAEGPGASIHHGTRPRNFDIAFHALKRGAESLDDLQTRCHQLQSDLVTATERHRLDLDAARQETAQWQKLASDLKDKFQWSQAQCAEAQRANALLEGRIAEESRRAEAAERRTQAFERIAMAFHDGIMSVFRESGSADA